MNTRAVIFDVYATLLAVGPPPADPEHRWQNLFQEFLHAPAGLSRLDFSVRCSQAIARRHVAARARGLAWPEIFWPSVVTELLPELARLTSGDRNEFIFRHIQTGHTTWLRPETADTLRWLKQHQCALGIVSNAQAYTLRELAEALAGQGLDLGVFERDLCFWSFEHGFSKPDPHVFQILTARLEARGITPAETLMVGDHLENDIEPARAFGWQTWHLAANAMGADAGDWPAMRQRQEPWLPASDAR